MTEYNSHDPVFCCGDLHGNFQWVRKWFNDHKIENCTVIFCGDIGMGFELFEKTERTVARYGIGAYCEEHNVNCFLFRGNHDDPSLFDGRMLSSDRLLLIPDYSLIHTPAHNILCVGGGLSIDRCLRKADTDRRVAQYLKYHPGSTVAECLDIIGRMYWEDEMPVFRQDELMDIRCALDTVCTHAAPSSFPPLTGIPQSYLDSDARLYADAITERGILNNLLLFVKNYGYDTKQWYYGHYHEYSDVWIDGINAVCLDMARDSHLCLKEIGNGRRDQSTEDTGAGASATD